MPKISKRALKKLARMAVVSLPTVGPALEILLEDLRESQSELDEEVQQAIASLQHSSQLVAHLEQGVRERTEKLERLRAEYDRYSQLAEIEADKAKALIEELSLTLGKSQKRERWVAFGINLIAGAIIFVAGVLLGAPVRRFLAWIF